MLNSNSGFCMSDGSNCIKCALLRWCGGKQRRNKKFIVMTDKEKLHQILSSLWKNDDSASKTYYNQALQDVQTAIDLQEEPASKDKLTFTSLPRLLDRIKPTDRAKWYSSRLADALEKEGYITDAKIVRESIKLMNGEKVPMATMDEEPVREDFEEALAKEWKGYNDRGAAKVDALEDNTQELAFAKGFYRGWHYKKEKPVSEDLGKYINELSKQFPEVSFAKLSRIAVRVAKWQLWQINEVLLSEVLPCFMHGGEADEVVAKLDEVLNKKK